MYDGHMDALMLHFRQSVHRDLWAGRGETRAWLEAPAFAWWAGLSFTSHEPDTVRA